MVIHGGAPPRNKEEWELFGAILVLTSLIGVAIIGVILCIEWMFDAPHRRRMKKLLKNPPPKPHYFYEDYEEWFYSPMHKRPEHSPTENQEQAEKNQIASETNEVERTGRTIDAQHEPKNHQDSE